MATGKVKNLSPQIDTTDGTILSSSARVNQFTEFYNSGTLSAEYVHLFIITLSCGGAADKRFLFNGNICGQHEMIHNGSNWSGLGVGAAKGTGANSESAKYYFTATPNTNVSWRVVHLLFPI